MQYRAEAIELKAGFFGRENKIAHAIQPVLDQYTKMGWDLHTCTIGGSDRGSSVILVFQKET